MPSLTFVMPHWLYWAGLILFPLVATTWRGVSCSAAPRSGPSLFIAYVFWLCSGFIGIHRFYLRSASASSSFPSSCSSSIAMRRCGRCATTRRARTPRSSRRRTRRCRRSPRPANATPEASAQYEHATAVVRQRQGRIRNREGGHRPVDVARPLDRDPAGDPAARRRRPDAGARAPAARVRRPLDPPPEPIVPAGVPAVAEPKLAKTRRCISIRASPTRSSGST